MLATVGLIITIKNTDFEEIEDEEGVYLLIRKKNLFPW